MSNSIYPIVSSFEKPEHTVAADNPSNLSSQKRGSQTLRLNAYTTAVCARMTQKKAALAELVASSWKQRQLGFNRTASPAKMGLRSAPLGDVALTTAKDTLYKRLRQVGVDRPVFSEFMNWERIGISAAHIGAMKGVLKLTSSARVIVSGQAIGKLQSVASAIADMKLNLEAARIQSVYFGTPGIKQT